MYNKKAKTFTLNEKVIDMLTESAEYTGLSNSAIVRKGIEMFHKDTFTEDKQVKTEEKQLEELKKELAKLKESLQEKIQKEKR